MSMITNPTCQDWYSDCWSNPDCCPHLFSEVRADSVDHWHTATPV